MPVILFVVLSTTTLPTVTLSKATSFAVATVISLPLRLILMLSPFRNCTVSLALTALAVSPLACNLKVWFCKLVMLLLLVATFWLVAYNWLPFTASVELEDKSPALTLLTWTGVVEPPPPKVTLSLVVLSYLTFKASAAAWSAITASSWPLLTASFVSVPASMPVILLVVLSTTTLPTVTLSKATAFAVATVISFPLRVILIFSPFRNCTVSLDLTALATSPLAWSLKVWFCRFVILVLLLAIFVAFVATFWLVAYNWLPFTASVLVSLIVPAATLVILSPPTLKPSAVLVNMVLLPVVLPMVTWLKLTSSSVATV